MKCYNLTLAKGNSGAWAKGVKQERASTHNLKCPLCCKSMTVWRKTRHPKCCLSTKLKDMYAFPSAGKGSGLVCPICFMDAVFKLEGLLKHILSAHTVEDCRSCNLAYFILQRVTAGVLERQAPYLNPNRAILQGPIVQDVVVSARSSAPSSLAAQQVETRPCWRDLILDAQPHVAVLQVCASNSRINPAAAYPRDILDYAVFGAHSTQHVYLNEFWTQALVPAGNIVDTLKIHTRLGELAGFAQVCGLQVSTNAVAVVTDFAQGSQDQSFAALAERNELSSTHLR